jgi:hypothetical protein
MFFAFDSRRRRTYSGLLEGWNIVGVATSANLDDSPARGNIDRREPMAFHDRRDDRIV